MAKQTFLSFQNPKTAVIILSDDSNRIQDVISAFITGKEVLTAGCIDRREAYKEYKLTITELIELQKQGKISPIRVGRSIYYSRQDIEAITKKNYQK